MESTQLQTFTCFSRLPLELRLLIWRLAQPGPRIVFISIIVLPHFRIIPLLPTTPITLAINQESRAETLKVYSVIHNGLSSAIEVASPRDTICLLTAPQLCIDRLDLILRRTPTVGSELKLRSLAIRESNLKSRGVPFTVDHIAGLPFLLEFIIMVAPVVGGAAQSRELQPGVEVKVEEGWGDAQLLTRFMRHIHDRRAVFSGEQIPTVKIMRVNAGACRGVDFCHVLNPPDSNRMENSILQCLAKK